MNMLYPTLVMGVVAITLGVFAYLRGDGSHLQGLGEGGKLLLMILPLLFFAFAVAGFIRVMVPVEVISRWVGGESGFRGIMIGCIAGALTPGGRRPWAGWREIFTGPAEPWFSSRTRWT